MAGLFITIEGADGSGKTTQIELLKKYFNHNNYDFIYTREPGGTIISEAIRNIILDKNYTEMNFKTEVLLYAASRAQHVEELIRPALKSGKIVLCDRYIDSSIVYQGIARGIGIDEVTKINEWATSGLNPDITFLLDLEPNIGLSRKQKQKELDRLELEKDAFHIDVVKGYRHIQEKDPDRIILIDASKTIEEVHQLIINKINNEIS
ncbi:dTMP kinase [Natranaerovirga pectinivora]|uniref:Thymidylate kinase n=1 Tax=Natranaerovirga pectinivora TaxID=682400 RepID=A0A4R3MDZ5_9FIRM|nr:dTMP kinase [Natranaerovirga pectinivora]TCT11686.1 dTMP kinase [Natranaerovirga pectinivora]